MYFEVLKSKMTRIIFSEVIQSGTKKKKDTTAISFHFWL